MEATNQSVEELVMCLVGMGFEVEDCQQAVRQGKLSIQDAIEWILSGKPGETSPNTLRLNQPVTDSVIGANPFTRPPPGSNTPELDSTEPAPTDEPQIVSRCHMNEEQRKVKERFEEKQREEARREAQQERLAQKRAHEAALIQIKEDREKLRSKKVQLQSPTDEPPVATQTPVQTAHTTLQIRLSDGRALKQQFEPGTSLSSVWQFIQTKCNTDSMCLMQPFPRQEYRGEHMSCSLQDLGLVPTGSLVLKKLDKKETDKDIGGGSGLSSSAPNDPSPSAISPPKSSHQPATSTPPSTPPPDTSQPPALHPAAPHGHPEQPELFPEDLPIFGGQAVHNWGAGNRLEDEDGAEPGRAGDM